VIWCDAILPLQRVIIIIKFARPHHKFLLSNFSKMFLLIFTLLQPKAWIFFFLGSHKQHFQTIFCHFQKFSLQGFLLFCYFISIICSLSGMSSRMVLLSDAKYYFLILSCNTGSMLFFGKPFQPAGLSCCHPIETLVMWQGAMFNTSTTNMLLVDCLLCQQGTLFLHNDANDNAVCR